VLVVELDEVVAVVVSSDSSQAESEKREMLISINFNVLRICRLNIVSGPLGRVIEWNQRSILWVFTALI